MISLWGMSDKIGPVSVSRISNPFLGGTVQSVEISPDLAREIDEEVQRLLTTLYEKAKKILEENKEAILKVAEKLVEKETLTCKEVVEILERYGVEVKNKCQEEDELKKKVLEEEKKEENRQGEEKKEEEPKKEEEGKKLPLLGKILKKD